MRTSLRRPARYAVIGVVNTVLYCFLLWTFLSIARLPHAVGVSVAFLIAMAFQYVANRHLTFGSHGRMSAELIRYFVVAGINYSVTIGIVWLALDIVETSRQVAALVAGVVTAANGYLLSVFWIFRSGSCSQAQSSH